MPFSGGGGGGVFSGSLKVVKVDALVVLCHQVAALPSVVRT